MRKGFRLRPIFITVVVSLGKNGVKASIWEIPSYVESTPNN